MPTSASKSKAATASKTKDSMATAARRVLQHPDVNQQGQALGRKGQLTRQRLIEAAEKLLHTKRLRDLRQADVCRVAKVSPPAFYVYFPDIETLVLEAIAINQVIPDELQQLLDEIWEPSAIFSKARAFVLSYVTYWDKHYHVLKARNLAADEGDPRVHELRFSVQVPIMERLAEKISEGQQLSGDNSLAPVAGASVIMSSLERLAATMRFSIGNDPRADMTINDLIDAEAWILTKMIGGTQPPYRTTATEQ
ncbi:MAG: TetR/AcrR family transcriptional regulator [Spongiibacteraceae bacterium]